MSVRVDSFGFFRPRFFKDRRSGKDRRKFLDPRYRNSAYPEFVDRRQGERRIPVYDDVQPLVKEHPFRKWIIVIGFWALFFLVCLFLFSNYKARERKELDRGRGGTVIIGRQMEPPMGKPVAPIT